MDDNDIEAQLREAAGRIDRGDDPASVTLPEVDAADKAPDPTPEGESQAPDADAPEGTEEPKAEAGSDEPASDSPKPEKAKGQPEDQDKKQAEKPKSDYEKAKEKAQRYEEKFRELHAEKRKLAEERDRFRDEREAWERRKATPPKQPDSKAKDYSPEDYEAAAKTFEDEGRTEEAKLARRKAEELRVARSQPKEDERPQADWRQDPKHPRFQESWNRNLRDASEEHPELKDTTSPLHKETIRVLREFPALKSRPDGILDATRIARGQAALSVENASLKAKTAELQAQVEKLNKALSPASGGRQILGRDKELHEMSGADMTEEDLRRLAMMADRG